MPDPERIDRRRAALIAYDVCRRALAPSGSGAAGGRCARCWMPWVWMIAAAHGRRACR